MKKLVAILFLMTICLSASFKASAIVDPRPAGTKTVGVMAGIDPFFRNVGIGGLAYIDYVLTDNWWKGHFTVGGQVGYEHFSRFKSNAFSVAPRITYGLNITERFEVHAGLSMGYYNYSGLGGFYHGEFIGVYYELAPSFKLAAQLGYTAFSPALCVGVAFQF